MNRITIALLALVTTSATAFAQAKPPVSNTTPVAKPAPAATAPVAPTASPSTSTAPAPTAARPSRAGISGMALFQANVSKRETDCRAKGSLFKWVPPHVPGDMSAAGKPYSSYSNGRCAIDNAAVRAASR